MQRNSANVPPDTLMIGLVVCNQCSTEWEALAYSQSLHILECPHCGKTINLYGSGGGENTAQAMGVQFLGRIPFDPHVVQCGDSGTSILDTHKDSMVTKAFDDVATKMSELV